MLLESVRVTVGVVIFTVALPGIYPLSNAVMLVLPGPTAVTGTETLVKFAGTVTDEGTVATVVWLLNKLTCWPLGPAAPERVSVRLPEELLSKLSGFGVSESVGVDVA